MPREPLRFLPPAKVRGIESPDQDLINALKAMLVGVGVGAGPELFRGHNEAFLRTVAVPRALEALERAGQPHSDNRHKDTTP